MATPRLLAALVLLVVSPLAAQEEAAEPAVPPGIAWRAGLMPLRPTGVDRFRQRYPQYDGRGVLIAILDSGIDPTIPGLLQTSTGERKVLDLRDFSGEGRVALAPVVARGDSVTVGRTRLGGLRALGVTGPLYGGALRELPLGEPPAADLNGNGVVGDTLPVLAFRGDSGWVVVVDSDGDRSLDGERPVRDYRVAGEVFGWNRPGRSSPLAIAANLRETGGRPELDLFFDTSGHGTHVAGIAAGARIAGVENFDGVAPGAWLLGLKIANNANGGISTTGSMEAALRYAVAFARERQLPLVLNLSFGVGSELEGSARIDRLVDSVLAANPDLVLAVSAGNDGPGLSTLGFPGSAARILSVGATFPGAFAQPGSAGVGVPETIASFSSRGGELAGPDLLAPGVAFSTKPRWNTGGEIEGGTSMAAPHVAGLAALLVGATVAEGRPVDGRRIRAALVGSATPLPRLGVLDQGAGLPDLLRAYQLSTRTAPRVDVLVRHAGVARGAAWRTRVSLTMAPTESFELERLDAGPPVPLVLQSDAPWLEVPGAVELGTGRTTVTLALRAALLPGTGVHTGTVRVLTADSAEGPLARLVVTVLAPEPAGDLRVAPAMVASGAERRVVFEVDSARAFVVEVSSSAGDSGATGNLHLPYGQPYPEEHSRPAAGGASATWRVDARDAQAGTWELVLRAGHEGAATLGATIRRSPLRVSALPAPGGVAARLLNTGTEPVEARVALLLRGQVRTVPVVVKGAARIDLPVPLPAWVRKVSIDAVMPREEWGRFTDFGLSLHDPAGRLRAKEPMNYALARLEYELPGTDEEGDRPASLVLGLFPGFASEADAGPVTLTLSIRLYAEGGTPLRAVGEEMIALPAGAQGEVRFRTPAPAPWPALPGYAPLGVIVTDIGDDSWTRDLPLPALGPAPRRGGRR